MGKLPVPMRRVLFVCAGNTCRSPMAAAIAQRMLGPSVHVQSAGVDADDGAPATSDAVRVMKERGLEISDHSSQHLSSVNVGDFDVVIGLTRTIAEQLRRAAPDPEKVKGLDVPDPYGKGIEVYRTTAIDIERQLYVLFGIPQP